MPSDNIKKKISIVTACYNEEGNIIELHDRLTNVMSTMPQYEYEIICIDNKSTDGTRKEIREICAKDPKFKAIFNVRNFGHIRSPNYAILKAKGDAVIFLCSDLEDPPEIIPEMLQKWEEGYKVVCTVRTSTEEKGIYPYLRKFFYYILNKLSQVKQISGLTGFGLYDKEVIQVFIELDDPYPYGRGLLAELGWEIAQIPFHKPVRSRGLTKNNILSYFEMGLLALVNHSKVPLRLSILTGVFISFISVFIGIYYFILKLIYWDQFQAGVAPALIGIFFLLGLLFLFLGIIGEYIYLVVTHVVHRPLVIEECRINFTEEKPPKTINSE
jgi:glycosyltransferase involved in cell wall biosynthesis